MKKKLKFWGTRGSCPVNSHSYVKFGGNTSCLEISYEGTTLIIDAGTGIRELGNILLHREEIPIQLFISHPHWDHIIGFPFFKPFNQRDQEITIWAPEGTGRSMKQLFDQLLAYEFCPIPFVQRNHHIEFKNLEQNVPVQIGPITLNFYPTCHQGVTFCFKIQTPFETIGYVTDNEIFRGYHGTLDNIPKEVLEPHLGLITFLSDCDTLVHEAQFFPEEYANKVNWGHSSVVNAVALMREAKIKRWLVVHHDPKHTDSDLERLEQLAINLLNQYQIPCKAQWIGDGFEFELK